MKIMNRLGQLNANLNIILGLKIYILLIIGIKIENLPFKIHTVVTGEHRLADNVKTVCVNMDYKHLNNLKK